MYSGGSLARFVNARVVRTPRESSFGACVFLGAVLAFRPDALSGVQGPPPARRLRRRLPFLTRPAEWPRSGWPRTTLRASERSEVLGVRVRERSDRACTPRTILAVLPNRPCDGGWPRCPGVFVPRRHRVGVYYRTGPMYYVGARALSSPVTARPHVRGSRMVAMRGRRGLRVLRGA